MNRTDQNPVSDPGARLEILPGFHPRLALLCCLLLLVGLSACGFLKPAKPTTHHYVLAPIPGTQTGSSSVAVGVGQVKLPAYLFPTSLAVRRGTNEIEYLTSALWAERLDTGFQRVLGANLSVLLSTDRIRLSTWGRDEVSAEVHVAVEQFDVDASGRGVLVARWRILSPGGEKTLHSGGSRLARQGASPDTGAGIVATLSELLADLSRELAQAFRAQTPASSR